VRGAIWCSIFFSRPPRANLADKSRAASSRFEEYSLCARMQEKNAPTRIFFSVATFLREGSLALRTARPARTALLAPLSTHATLPGFTSILNFFGGMIRMKLRIAVLLSVLALGSSFLHSQQPPAPRPVAVDDLFEIREVQDLQISPDAQFIAYAVVSTSCPEARFVLVVFSDVEPDWSPNGKLLAFSSNRSKPDPDATYAYNIWVVPADNPDNGANPTQVTTGLGGDRQPAWSPDGKWIAFSTQPDPKLFNYGTKHIAVAPSTGGQAKVHTLALDRIAVNPRLAPGGRSSLFVVDDDGTPNLAQVNVDDGKVTRPIGGRLMLDTFSVAKDGTLAANISTMDRPYVNSTPGGAENLLIRRMVLRRDLHRLPHCSDRPFQSCHPRCRRHGIHQVVGARRICAGLHHRTRPTLGAPRDLGPYSPLLAHKGYPHAHHVPRRQHRLERPDFGWGADVRIPRRSGGTPFSWSTPTSSTNLRPPATSRTETSATSPGTRITSKETAPGPALPCPTSLGQAIDHFSKKACRIPLLKRQGSPTCVETACAIPRCPAVTSFALCRSLRRRRLCFSARLHPRLKFVSEPKHVKRPDLRLKSVRLHRRIVFRQRLGFFQ
jgi:WD40-like Beta Propeller Repeat